eukprot:TRINITY_DN16306_c0_g1_i2.p1 TRINITY_DN16306_c0_g1~~TRINITY_DN16306_c0_g1_i2.p1  ORF type:complete len:362 (-),score=14.40 TRINITY_DN16306_c0_g1_i2:210-1235(-)
MDTESLQRFPPTSLAATAGCLWGFGILGRRIGVQGAPDHLKPVCSVCTTLVFYCSVVTFPILNLFFADLDPVSATLQDPAWLRRVPVIAACGLVSCCGSLLSTLALAWSANVNSALIAMIDSGVYTVCSPLFVAIVFGVDAGPQEQPWQYVSGVLVLLGVALAQMTSKKTKADEVFAARGSFHDEDSDHEDEDESPPKKGALALNGLDAEALFSPAKTHESEEEFSGSDTSSDSDIIEAPAGLQWAAAMAAGAGVCWATGPVAKKYGVVEAPEGHHSARVTCTYSMATKGSILGVLVPIVESGVTTLTAAVLISVVFCERPTILKAVSGTVIFAAVILGRL